MRWTVKLQMMYNYDRFWSYARFSISRVWLENAYSRPKIGAFRGKIGEGVGRYWPPTSSFLLLWVYTSVSYLVKIDGEMPPWECPQTDIHTHAHTHARSATHAQTQNDFIICPMLYAIGIGQIITVTIANYQWMNLEVWTMRKANSNEK